MLRILSDKKKNYFYNQMIGKNLEILFESKDENGMIKGFSSNYIRVQKEFEDYLENQIYIVEAKSIKNSVVTCEIKEKKNSVALEISSI